MARLRDRRTLSAARASLSTGPAISQVSNTEDSRVTPIATRMKGISARRWAAMILSTSTASSVRAPSTACTRCTGMDTETTRPPSWAVRMSHTVSPFSALATSLFSDAWARATTSGLVEASLSRNSPRSCRPPRLRAGGSGRHSTRSVTT